MCIFWDEADQRELGKRLGTVWRPARKVWEMHWADVRRLGFTSRVVSARPSVLIPPSHPLAYVCGRMLPYVYIWLHLHMYAPSIVRMQTNHWLGVMTERADDSIKWSPLEGGCACRAVRYRMEAKPLFVHCCHCRWCQRESGSAFALNALVEAEQVKVLAGEPDIVDTPSHSGKGQKIARCPECRVALWSNYYQAGPTMRFVRVGTLDDPDRLPPDIHIFTSSKQPWVVLPRDAVAVAEFYSVKECWPQESLQRIAAARAGKSRGEP